MRAKKWLTILTGVCTVVGLVVAFLFGKSSIGYDISLATFGSALLGFIMSLTEYFVERRKAMEQFWKESCAVLQRLRKMRYLDLDAPHDLLIDCIQEQQENEWNAAIYAGTKDGESKRVARDKLITWIDYNEVFPSITKDDDFPALLESVCDLRISRAIEEFESIFARYIELSQISLSELDNAYGNLDFMFANRSIRLHAYSSIYNRLSKLQESICTEAFHFRKYKENHGNIVVCAKKAVELDSMFFKRSTSSYKGMSHECIYQSAMDEIDDSIEDFRIHIYRNTQRVSVVHAPVKGAMIFSDHDKS